MPKVSLTTTPRQTGFAPILVTGPTKDAIEMAAELGFDGVEIHLLNSDDIDAAETRKLCDRHGLEIPTIGTGMAAGVEGLTFSDPDPAVRQLAVERIRRHIDLAIRLNSGVTVGLIYGNVGKDPGTQTMRRQYSIDCLSECCEIAQTKGVDLFLEPLNRYESDQLNTMDQGLRIIQKIGSDSLKLLADTFHMNLEEKDIAAALRETDGHLGHAHLVDSNREVIGRGHLDLRSILSALKDINYAGHVAFEALPIPSGREAAVAGVGVFRGLLNK